MAGSSGVVQRQVESERGEKAWPAAVPNVNVPTLDPRFRLLFGSSLLGIAYFSESGQLTDVNEALLGMMGFSANEATSLSCRELIPSPHFERLTDELQSAPAQRSIEPFEAEILCKDGSHAPVLLGAALEENGSGRGVFFVLDNRARKYAEQAQRFITEAGNVLASSLDYEQTLEQAARLAVPSYADWCFVDLLQAGDAFDRVVVAHSAPEHAELAQSLRRTFPNPPQVTQGKVWKSELYVDVTDALLGEQAREKPHLEFLRGLDIRSYMVVPLVARQQLIGTITFASAARNYDSLNLTCAEELARRAALAIDNAKLYRDAQAATRAREEFLSMASHELKTPLSSLKLQVQGLLRSLQGGVDNGRGTGGLDATRLESGLQMIRRQVDRQAKLVDTLLDVSRISAGRIALEGEEFDLTLLLREVTARFEHELNRTDTALRVDCPPTLRVMLDRIRMDQILTNLLSNAIKYGCRRPINVTVQGAGSEVRIVVRDRGIGISEKDRARIFGQFERAVSERNFGGFGLGLWITHQIIVAMGGSISVESALGAGSTFTVQLPLRMS